ncbi:MAG: YeiH family protein [Myxococcota bacterium]
MVRQVSFLLLAVASLTPWVNAPMALVAGVVFALAWGNPYAAKAKTVQTWLLQASVVGLGAAMNLSTVLRVGASGLLQTAIGISVTLGLAFLLARALRTEATTSLLIGVGTAICGGSAIAAVAPAIGAKSHQTSVALVVVFLLNAAALLIFPPLGHLVGLDEPAFGLWSALAIHDTSSVVGASSRYGEAALMVGTTVKLARALWIIPLTLVLAKVWKHDPETAQAKPKRPWFIFGFVAVAALVTWVPFLQAPGKLLAMVARQVLVLTLFLVGAGVSREAVRQVGLRPIVLGVVLWVLVGSATLGAIKLGVLVAPSL